MTGRFADLPDLAREHGTPLYVYDVADLRRAHADLREAIGDGSTLYYSLKANPHPLVAGELARIGCATEIASAGEVGLALAAGFAPADILFTGPAKSDADLDTALTAGIRRFSVDSPTDLGRLARAAAEHGAALSCLLRVNADQAVPGMGLTMAGIASQFGADASWVTSCPEAFASVGGARVSGLHLYMGTNIDDPEVLYEQFATSMALAGALRRVLGTSLTDVNLGGGFAVPYARRGGRPSYRELASRLPPVCDRNLPGWRDGGVRLAFESGRYLAGGCGVLVCQVIDVKVSKGRTFVLLDAGINQLGGMSGLRRVPRIVPDLLPLTGLAASARGGWVEDCVVAGPLCTPLDTWCQGVRLPRLRPGDLVATPNVGAYGLTASLVAFLGHDPAPEVVVDSDRPGAPPHVSRLALVREAVRAPALAH